jgi:porin
MRAVALAPAWLLAAIGAASGAAAQAPTGPNNAPVTAAPAERETPVPGQTGTGTSQPPGEPGGLWERSTLLGDLGGVRTRLEKYGVSLGLTETSEVLGNATGGRARGVVYEGVTEASLGLDLGKAIGLAGGTLNVSAFQIHGRGLSTNYVDNLNVVSSIEADRATRLFELWYQQVFLGGRMDVKVGQQSADLEFAISQYAGLFVNASFGWPTLAAVDLPAGGPSYPLAALGARLRARPVEPLTVLLGVFNGSPAGIGTGDPQRRNPSGTSFRLGDGVFAIGEVQYAVNAGENASGLPGTYKLGAWYNSNAFTDQFFAGSSGITAAGPFAIPPRARRGDWSVYAVADQLIWRPAGTKSGVGVFARAMGAPGDRNQVNLFADGGVTYKGVFGRENDTVGLGVGWARISDRARAGDAALTAFGGSFIPVRTGEIVLELSYQHQIAPWWQVQPDFQYVFNPGGGITNPDRPGQRVGNAAIFGLRTTITF